MIAPAPVMGVVGLDASESALASFPGAARQTKSSKDQKQIADSVQLPCLSQYLPGPSQSAHWRNSSQSVSTPLEDSESKLIVAGGGESASEPQATVHVNSSSGTKRRAGLLFAGT